jgi:hypothetical protein
MSNKSNSVVSNIITIKFGSSEIQVDYKPGYRPLQFMQKNKLTDEDTAKEMFTVAKAAHAAKLNASIQSEGSKAIKAQEKVAWKGGVFAVTAVVEYDRGQATEAHRELIEDWKRKKAIESVKAENRANEYLAMLDSQMVKVA